MLPKQIAAALLGVAASFVAVPAWAGADDYAFEPMPQQAPAGRDQSDAAGEVKTGAAQEIAVRLVRKAGGQPVAGAVIFQTRLDMAPDNMADMTTKIVAAPSAEPGVYRFKADFTMAGRWLLTLAAKVQGESETVKGTVIFTAKD